MTEFQKYIQRYLDLIPTQNWLEQTEITGSETELFYRELTEKQADFAYAEGKWSLKVLLQHLIDSEKIFHYRALRFSRNDKTELPGWDEEPYGKNNNVSHYKLHELVNEFSWARNLTISFFSKLDPETLQRKGIANGNEISVETLGKLIVGHNIHHLNIIKERYIPLLND